MISGGIVIILLITLLSITLLSRPKLGYVNLSKAYNEFELKKELDKKLTTIQQLRKNNLDSLELGLKTMSNQMRQEKNILDQKAFDALVIEFQTRRQDFLEKQKKFSEDNDAMTSQYMDQIWKQMNQFVSNYGKEKGYQSIVGGDGTGNVMYASPDIDITNDVVQYINKQYKGN
jgi:outer membrane protein